MGEKLGARVDLRQSSPEICGTAIRRNLDQRGAGENAAERAGGAGRWRDIEAGANEDVEATVIGEFGTENRELILNYRDTEVGRVSMRFLHEGLPMPTRRAIVAVINLPTIATHNHN